MKHFTKDAKAQDHLSIVEELSEVYTYWTKFKRTENLVNFHDQISLVNHLLTTQAEIARAVAARFRYLLVDEFQVLLFVL